MVYEAGDAATKALKLYEGGDVLNVNPSGANVTGLEPSLEIVEVTLQSVDSGRLSFVSPAGISVEFVDDPHARVTVAGDVSKVTAQSVSLSYN